MSEEMMHVKNALVEAVTAHKMIEEKLGKARKDLETWRKRLELARGQAEVEQQVADRIRQLELLIAELEADLMAQEDLESQLKATIFKLEHSVSIPPPPRMPDFDDGQETIDRLEGRILESEAMAELTSHKDERKMEDDAKNLALDDELEALKKAVKKKKDDK